MSAVGIHGNLNQFGYHVYGCVSGETTSFDSTGGEVERAFLEET
jgi:hypothetical protein